MPPSGDLDDGDVVVRKGDVAHRVDGDAVGARGAHKPRGVPRTTKLPILENRARVHTPADGAAVRKQSASVIPAMNFF